jgi:two-component system, chemotaxis family, protein-glutamate methylesterase/glutaminase
MSDNIVRLLIIDDSAYIRKVFKEMLERHPKIEVVGTAHNGREALDKVAELSPDVILVDLYMPDMDGVQFLKEQMVRKPLPVLVCSSADREEENVLAAMDAGALDFIRKPTARATEELYSLEKELVEKILAAGTVELDKLPMREEVVPVRTAPNSTRPRLLHGRFDVLLIGASTGGPKALRYLISSLPEDFHIPVAMVLHMPVGYTGPFAARLDDISPLEVLQAEEGMEMKAGRVILARAGYHLTLVREGSGKVVCHLDQNSIPETPHCPSVDTLFRSAAAVYRSKTLGLVLTGMGNDGMQGAAWIKSEGGVIFAEAEETSVVFGMPYAVIEAGLSDRILPLHGMIDAVLEIM